MRDALDASESLSIALAALSSRAKSDQLPFCGRPYIRLLSLVWCPIMRDSAFFNGSIMQILSTHERGNPQGLNVALKRTLWKMAKVVKSCRRALEEASTLAAPLEAQAAFLAATTRVPIPPPQLPSMLGYITEILQSGSFLSKRHSKPTAPPTVELIHDLLVAINRLSLAVEGVEVYWAKRLHWVEQVGVPITMTWDELTAVSPAWGKLLVYCFGLHAPVYYATLRISKLKTL